MKRMAFLLTMAWILFTAAGCMQFGLPVTSGGPPTFNVAGRIVDGNGNGLAGATIAISGGVTVTAGSDGKWSATGLSGSVTLTPQKDGYAFTPASRTVSQAATGLDFTGAVTGGAQTYTAWITIDDLAQEQSAPAGTVTYTLSNGSTVTSDQRYVPLDGLSGTVTVTPSLSGQIFIPASQTVTAAQSGAMFFESLPATGALSGRLAFSDLYGKGVYIVGDDGSGLVALKADSGSNEYASTPAISPDGRMIAFHPDTPDGTLSTMSVDGSQTAPLAQDAYYAFADPAWSRDGAKIVYAATENVGGKTVEGAAFAVVAAGGGPPSVVVPDDAKVNDLLEPDWSPDGTRLLFFAGYNGGGPGIFVMNADGTQVAQLRRVPMDVWGAAQVEPQPQWSPDGTKIAFLAPSAAGTGSHVWIMAADGQNAADDMPDSTDDVTAVCWSPDGSKLAFAVSGIDPAIYTIGPDGSNRTLLTKLGGTFGAARLSWGGLG